MKKILATLTVLLFLGANSFSQTEKIALGVTPLAKSASIGDNYMKTMVGQIYDRAVEIKELNVISRTPEDIQKIIIELDSVQTDPATMDAKTRAEFGKRAGATHFVTGEITTISIKKVEIKKVRILGLEKIIYGKLANIVVNLRVVNVSTGQVEFSKQITSNSIPDKDILTSDERVINNKIREMGKDISEFLKTWYNEKTTSK